MAVDFPKINNQFQFRCTQCADCCTGDQTVLLNLYDLYKLSRHLKLPNTRELFEKNILVLKFDEENMVFRPQIRFKTRPFKFCPFLTNEWLESGQIKGWCQLHPQAKPLVCALSPVGVRFDAQEDRIEFLLVPPTSNCPGMKESTIQSLDQYLLPYESEIEWQKVFFKILERCKSKKWSASDFKQHLYSFSVSEPFEQILSNLQKKFLSSHSKAAQRKPK